MALATTAEVLVWGELIRLFIARQQKFCDETQIFVTDSVLTGMNHLDFEVGL
jgi:hypothetical protein